MNLQPEFTGENSGKLIMHFAGGPSIKMFLDSVFYRYAMRLAGNIGVLSHGFTVKSFTIMLYNPWNFVSGLILPYVYYTVPQS
ncbi:hypothetical protein KEF85_09885 [Methylomonas paludis]|uniref:Uncharacterized protein n=1 Tax=Methylomonas paludis TaxID=1173101 RepID=A0A975MSD9_9GAMM|nr:hypothetical protein [Methylomonas paludis]QWF72624.1 hypothetical protein KEF85_09885 [Methylomonas paludis]